jgi:hypothetical protein
MGGGGEGYGCGVCIEHTSSFCCVTKENGCVFCGVHKCAGGCFSLCLISVCVDGVGVVRIHRFVH